MSVETDWNHLSKLKELFERQLQVQTRREMFDRIKLVLVISNNISIAVPLELGKS